VYDLEEACDELKAREQQLDTDLRSADEAFDQAKTHYETLVTALKEARKKLQDERDEAVGDARDLESRAIAEREKSRREKEVEIDKIRRTLAEREQVSFLSHERVTELIDRLTHVYKASLMQLGIESPSATEIFPTCRERCARSKLRRGSWVTKDPQRGMGWSWRSTEWNVISFLPKMICKEQGKKLRGEKRDCARKTSSWPIWYVVISRSAYVGLMIARQAEGFGESLGIGATRPTQHF